MSSMKPTEWAMLVVLSIFWGGSFFGVEIALRGFQPLALVFLRVTIAAIILLLVVYIRGHRMPSSLKTWGAYFVMGALGLIAILGAAISYSCAGIFGKRFKQESPIVTSTGMLICSSIMMAPPSIFSGSLGASVFSIQAIAAVLGIAAISTAMAYLLYFRILASAGATNVLLVTFLIPISALLLGIGVLGEVIHGLEYAGMGGIFLGLIVIDGRVLRWLKTYFRANQEAPSAR